MSEYVHVPTSLWGLQGDIASVALEVLAAQGKLPNDFEFRALTIQDVKERHEIALQDVRAALGIGEPSGHPYMTQELPDCITVPIGGTKSRTEILREVSCDYHQLGTLLGIAEDSAVRRYHGYQSWAGYLKFLDPQKYAALQRIKEPGPRQGSFSKGYNYKNSLLDVVIKDSALVPIYENPDLIPGHGPIKQGILRILLQDNHPEIEILPED
jgi:hypothetical protein